MSINIPLSVTDYAGMDRVDEPITSGVPLPESANIFDPRYLEVCDADNNCVSTQFTVLSRWKGTPNDESKPIKWVLLDFNADVDSEGTSTYYLKDSNVDTTPDTNISVVEDENTIIIDTGVAKFEINKNHFNLFDYVHIGDNEVLSQPGKGGIVLTGADGVIYRTILEAPEEIVIEEHGSMRTVVKIRGVFKADDGSYFCPSINDATNATKEFFDGLGYTYSPSIIEGRFFQPYEKSFVYYNVRIHFYNNNDYVKVFFTLENNGANGRTTPEQYYAPIQGVYFDSVDLILKTNAVSTVNVSSEDSSTRLDSSDSFTLYQDWRENLTDKYTDTLEPVFEDGIYYLTKKNSEQLSSGLTNPGWVDANDGSRGVELAIRHFWQNFPKKITVDNSEVKIGLWPEEGYYPYCQHSDFTDSKYDMYCQRAGRDGGAYLFDAGTHKTYEMLLRFYNCSQDTRTKHLSKSLEHPLMALAPSEWYVQTKALGMIGPAGLTSNDSEINESMQRFDKLQTSLVYEEDSENGLTIPNLKTKNPPNWESAVQNRFFNWMNFGDMLWGASSPCSLHYDWTYLMLLHYIRTGKRNLFDVGVEMAKHRFDIDQYHGERTSTQNHHKYINHFQFYESTGHSSPSYAYYPSRVSGPTHTWNGGLVFYYLLTGDKKAWEAAEENGKGVLNIYGSGGLRSADNLLCPNDEIRNQGWAVLNLVNLYRANGNPVYLNVAKNIAKNILLYREQQVGGEGHWGADSNSGAANSRLKPFSCVEGGCGSCINTEWSTMYIYIVAPLIEISYETRDDELNNLIIRMADFLKDCLIYGGDYDDSGNYRPLQSQYLWVAEDPEGAVREFKGEPVKTLFWADLFSYAYQLTNDLVYLDLARKSFRDGMFYYAKPGSQYFDHGARSPITYMDNMFPNSHTKVHGWIGRTNQVYLNTEWQLQQGDKVDGDLNGDGIVNVSDYSSMIYTIGKLHGEQGYNLNADYNNDGWVSYSDFKTWYNYYQGAI